MRKIWMVLMLGAACSSSGPLYPCPDNLDERTTRFCTAKEICVGHPVDGGGPIAVSRQCQPKPDGCGSPPSCACVPSCQGCQATSFGSGALAQYPQSILLDCSN